MATASLARRSESSLPYSETDRSLFNAASEAREDDHSNNGDDDDGDDDEWLFSCRCESAKAITTLLSCLQQQQQHHQQASLQTAMTMTTTTPLDRRDVVTPSPHHRHYPRGGQYRNGNDASSSSASSSTIQPVLVFCSPTHLTFHVHGKVCQSSVDMPAGLFSQFDIFPHHQQQQQQHQQQHQHKEHGDEWQASGEFCVNLNTVLDCCQTLGTVYLDQTKLGWSYNVTKEMLQIELMMNDNVTTSATTATTATLGQEHGTDMSHHQQQQQQQQQQHSTQVLCTAALPGLVPPDWNTSAASSLALAFRSSPMSARIIVPSMILREAMTELELVPAASSSSLTTVQVTFSQQEGLQLSVVGPTSECLVTLPSSLARGRGAKVTMELLLPPATTPLLAPQPPHQQQPAILRHVYPWNSWRNAMKALDIATETCLSMNQHGMMAIQHQVILMGDDSHPCFCDYIMCCLDDEEKDDDDDEEDETNGEIMDSQTTTSLPVKYGGVSQESSSSSSSFTLGWNRHRQATQESNTSVIQLRSPILATDRDGSRAANNNEDDKDEEDEGDNGHRHQDLSTGNDETEEDDDDDDDDNDRDMDEALFVPPAPLFGSVVRMDRAEEHESGRRPTSSASSIRQRRRLGRPTTSTSDHDDGLSLTSSLRSSTSRGYQQMQQQQQQQQEDSKDDVDHDEEEDMPLDITENDISSPTRKRLRKGGDRGCSSPEIVYGK